MLSKVRDYCILSVQAVASTTSGLSRRKKGLRSKLVGRRFRGRDAYCEAFLPLRVPGRRFESERETITRPLKHLGDDSPLLSRGSFGCPTKFTRCSASPPLIEYHCKRISELVRVGAGT